MYMLKYETFDRPDHKDFSAIYDLYKKLYPLETEQESRENFEAYLKANGPKMPGKELWVYASDDSGKIAGASNFNVYPAAPGHGVDAAALAIYTFVDKDERQKGIFKQLLKEQEKSAGEFLHSRDANAPKDPVVITFAEQNNPLMMTPRQYLEDTAAAMDQNLRRDVWEKEGFRTLKLRYVQPPLGPGEESCRYLDLVVKAPEGVNKIHADVVEKFLTDFMKQSMPEGTSFRLPSMKAVYADLQAAKQGDGMIELSPPGKFGAMMSNLNVETLSKLPEDQKDRLIGEIYPELTQQFFGQGAAIKDVMNRGYNSADAAAQAFSSRDVNAILAAIQNGQIQPNDPRLAAFAKANPAIAAQSPVLAALLPEQPANAKAPQTAPQPEQTTAEAPKPIQPQPKYVTSGKPATGVTASTGGNAPKPPKLPPHMKSTSLSNAIKDALSGMKPSSALSGGDKVRNAQAQAAPLWERMANPLR